MVNASPIIPYEMGKYITFILLIWGITINKKGIIIGWLLFAILIPGVVLGFSKGTTFQHIVFNVFGLINFALGIVFFSGIILKKNKIVLLDLMRLLIYALLVALIFAFLVTPKYDDIDFNLTANFQTTAGFGSNQVSTAFGLAVFLLFYMWFSRSRFSGFNINLDLLLCLFFLFQGLLTFSRGGVIGGVIGVVLILFGVLFSNMLKGENRFIERAKSVFLYFIPLILILILAVNKLTDGYLFLRYQGESVGTLSGSKDKNINSLTSGRFEIFEGDLEIFSNNIFLGVGVNQSRYIRNFHEGVVAHVETSRLLAEHGIFGLFIVIFLFYVFFSKMYLLSTDYSVLYILFIIGFYTTFHAATRTFISPLIMSLIFVKLNNLSKN
jgi:hypothetical protein